MDPDQKSKLYGTLLGLKSTISGTVRTQRNCHYNVGQTLTFVRSEYLKLVPAEERAFTEATIPSLQFTVPRPNDLGVWTVDPAEAWRLYSQLEQLLASQKAQGGRVSETTVPQKEQPSSRRVFLVHGHDDAARETTARFLEKLGFEPIILHEQANAGQTVVEKLEAHANVPFAIVLLTPDDEGRKAGTEVLRKRARQNVVLELGYFLGRLGRKNVCALHRGDVEIPSDYLGVLFIGIDDAGGWRLQVAREMKAAGLEVDMNRAG